MLECALSQRPTAGATCQGRSLTSRPMWRENVVSRSTTCLTAASSSRGRELPTGSAILRRVSAT